MPTLPPKSDPCQPTETEARIEVAHSGALPEWLYTSSREYEVRNMDYPPLSRQVPARSTLFHLTPEGIGTPYVESLASYVMRLAGAHGVTCNQLFRQVIAPAIHAESTTEEGNAPNVYGDIQEVKRDPIPFMSFLYSAYQGGRYLVGTRYAKQERVLKALKSLTRQPDLPGMTLLKWSNVLAPQNLIRPTKAWCPACYESMRLSTLPIYEPLLWAVSVVTVCPEHNVPLETRCPACSEPASYLGGPIPPGYCPACQAWLGSGPVNTTHRSDEAYADSLSSPDWSAWVAHAVGRLLAYSSSCRGDEVERNVPDVSQGLNGLISVIHGVINDLFEGNLTEFARMLRLSRMIPRVWESTRKSVRLDLLLYVCYCVDVDLLNVLLDPGRETLKLRMERNDILKRVQQAVRPKERHVSSSLAGIEQRLGLILDDPASNRFSAPDIAAQLGFDTPTILRNHFPKEYSALSTRFREWQQIEWQRKLKETLETLIPLIAEFSEQGLTPHWIRVRNAIRERYPNLSGMPRHPDVYRAYLAARAGISETEQLTNTEP